MNNRGTIIIEIYQCDDYILDSIDETESDYEEFDDKLQELKGCIDKVAWYAHARDHNKALKALDRIIYAVSRDLDE